MRTMKTMMMSLFAAALFATGVGAGERLPVVAIADYCQTNGVVSVRRNMAEAILKAGCLPVVLPEMEDAAADQFLSHCDAVMIGGGIKGQDYPRRCAYEERVIALAVKRGMPIVGICHGCQVINRHFGGTLMAGVFGEGSVKLNSSHTMRCLNPAPGFRVTARAEDGVIEAIEHETLPIFGFQFHPEIYWKKDARCLELLRLALRGKRK